MKYTKRRRWTTEDHTMLRSMYGDRASLAEMAAALYRTQKAVQFRLATLGLSVAGMSKKGAHNPPPKHEKKRVPSEEVRNLAMSGSWR